MSRVPMHKPAATTGSNAPIPIGLAGGTPTTPEVRIQINSNPLYLSGTRELVACVARRLGFSEDSCSQIALAVDEALANVIRHGYQKAADRPIWISLYPIPEDGHSGPFGDQCPARSIRIVIEDEARQVDPAVIKSRDLDEIRPGGLGVHIIKTVMDMVHYEKRESIGMRLTMVKHRHCCKDAGGESAGSGGPCAPSCEQTQTPSSSCAAPPSPSLPPPPPLPRTGPMADARKNHAELSVKSDRREGAVIVIPTGEIDLTSSPVLRNELKKIQADRPARLVIDLAGVPYMDSAGVATLVEAMQFARKSSTRLVLCAMTDKVRSIFEISRLDTVFTIVRDQSAALSN